MICVSALANISSQTAKLPGRTNSMHALGQSSQLGALTMWLVLQEAVWTQFATRLDPSFQVYGRFSQVIEHRQPAVLSSKRWQNSVVWPNARNLANVALPATWPRGGGVSVGTVLVFQTQVRCSNVELTEQHSLAKMKQIILCKCAVSFLNVPYCVLLHCASSSLMFFGCLLC